MELKQTADKDQSKKILAQTAVKQIIERKYTDRYESNPDIVKPVFRSLNAKFS